MWIQKLDALSAILSLVGVIFVAQPEFLFGTTVDPEADTSASDEGRYLAIGAALVSAVFAAVAYISVRQAGPEV